MELQQSIKKPTKAQYSARQATAAAISSSHSCLAQFPGVMASAVRSAD